MDKTDHGRYRKQMKRGYSKTLYHQRNKDETIVSVIKRLFGEHISSRQVRTQNRELSFRCIAYNMHRLTDLAIVVMISTEPRYALTLILTMSVALTILLLYENVTQQIVMGQLKDDSTQRGLVETFKAAGTISSLAADTLMGSNNSLGTHSDDLWILGGNWSFSIVNGNLSDFNVDIVMTKYDGTERHTHSIGMLKNATGAFKGAIPPAPIKAIVSTDKNYTSFMGNANISRDHNIKYQNVPIVMYLFNGNIINITPDPIKTKNHFKGLPIYGTVSSITYGSDKIG